MLEQFAAALFFCMKWIVCTSWVIFLIVATMYIVTRDKEEDKE